VQIRREAAPRRTGEEALSIAVGKASNHAPT
jgi:hypothetical protein